MSLPDESIRTTDRPLDENDRIYSARQLPASTKAPGQARTWSADSLGRWGLSHLVDVTQTVVSELVTNSVKHGAKRISALIEWHRAMELVEVLVWDDARGQPEPQEPNFISEGGRGLFLVEGLAAKWGHHPSPDGGKVVWAQLPTDRRRL